MLPCCIRRTVVQPATGTDLRCKSATQVHRAAIYYVDLTIQGGITMTTPTVERGWCRGGHFLLVLLQSIKELQNGGFRQATKLLKVSKLAIQRCITEGFFHGQILEGESLIYEVDSQHFVWRERRPVGTTFGVVKVNQTQQFRRRDNLLHLIQESCLRVFFMR